MTGGLHGSWPAWAMLALGFSIGTGSGCRRDSRAITSLSVEQAQAATRGMAWLDLAGLTTISPEVAAVLANHQGHLSLNGLTTLSPEAAAALADRVDSLELNGVTTLSPEAAAALRANDGIRLPATVKP